MWGAYFVPRVIHRHEESSSKAGDRYKNAIRSVSQAQPSRASFSPEFMDPMQKSKIIAQRRTIFSGLTFLFIASGIAATLGMMAWSILAIPVSGFAIFIVAVRRQLVTAELKAQRLDTLQKIMTAEIKLDPEARISLRADAQSTEHWIRCHLAR